jgi:hypothetical protein
MSVIGIGGDMKLEAPWEPPISRSSSITIKPGPNKHRISDTTEKEKDVLSGTGKSSERAFQESLSSDGNDHEKRADTSDESNARVLKTNKGRHVKMPIKGRKRKSQIYQKRLPKMNSQDTMTHDVTTTKPPNQVWDEDGCMPAPNGAVICTRRHE